VVGGEQHPPEILGEQHDLKPDRPLHRIHEILGAVFIGHDSGAVAIALIDHPFLRLGGAAAIELAQYIARQRDGLAEHHLTDIDADILVGVDGLDQPRRAG
jgi:hypothetical protein